MLQALGKLRVFSQHNCICLELSFPYWIHGSPKTPQKQRWEKHSDLLLRCTNFRTVKYSIACNQKRTKNSFFFSDCHYIYIFGKLLTFEKHFEVSIRLSTFLSSCHMICARLLVFQSNLSFRWVLEYLYLSSVSTSTTMMLMGIVPVFFLRKSANISDIQMEEVISSGPFNKVPYQIPVLWFPPTLNTPNQCSVVRVIYLFQHAALPQGW